MGKVKSLIMADGITVLLYLKVLHVFIGSIL